MRTVDVLIAAKKLISEEWKYAGATPATPAQRKLFHSAKKYLSAAVASPGYSTILNFNDSRNVEHGTVMKAFDVAIKNAKRRHVNGGRTKAVHA